MKMTTLEDVYAALKGEGGKEIVLEPDILEGAKRAINKMLELGN